MRITINQLVAGILMFALFYAMYIGLFIMMDYLIPTN